jgi:hypothetical protein
MGFVVRLIREVRGRRSQQKPICGICLNSKLVDVSCDPLSPVKPNPPLPGQSAYVSDSRGNHLGDVGQEIWSFIVALLSL